MRVWTQYLENHVQEHVQPLLSCKLPRHIGWCDVKQVGPRLCADGVNQHLLPNPPRSGYHYRLDEWRLLMDCL